MPFTDPGETMVIQGLRFKIKYGSRGAGPDAPNAGGLIIELGENEFLVFGINFSLKVEVASGETGEVFIADKWEYLVVDDQLKRGRCMNGDERNMTGCGPAPEIFVFKVDKHK
ncbi:MAG: hypothetical protein E7233_06965 [Lachnospiraceae bacterium]|nr:hypothetical protein [Lachnospiraceae bacterium]